VEEGYNHPIRFWISLQLTLGLSLSFWLIFVAVAFFFKLA
jgi:hypothetical protein